MTLEGKKEKRLFLSQLFQDHMMLQREKPLRFYGEADEMVRKVSVEYTAKTGIMPIDASPAEKVTACCSAMPTSKNLLGNSSAKLQRDA